MTNKGIAKPRRPQITEVAKEAGVSISTVSRVLHNTSPVSEEKTQEVLDAIKKINYMPNLMASRLKNVKVKLVGVILPNLLNTVIMRIAGVILSENQKRGIETLFTCSENNAEKELMILDLFRSSLVDGVIVASVLSDSQVFTSMEEIGIPVVLFDRIVGDVDWIGEDNVYSSYEMTKYIIKKGHRKIVFIKGIEGTSIGNNRFDGYKRAMEDYNVLIKPEYLLTGNFSEKLAYDQVKILLENLNAKEYPTAIFSANTDMAFGAMKAITEKGLKIPEDISISSYGDPELPAGVHPRFTCIKQNHKEIGKRLSERMLEKFKFFESDKNENELPQLRIIVPTKLVEGETILDLQR